MDGETEYIRILRAMTPDQKLRAADALIDFAVTLKASLLRAEHPDWQEEHVQSGVRAWFLQATS